MCHCATEICTTSSCHFCLLLVPHHHLHHYYAKYKVYEAVLEFVACDVETARTTEDESGTMRWVSHLKLLIFPDINTTI